MNKQVIEAHGKLYQVVRTISESQVNGNIEALKAWVEILHCDRSFKHEGKFYIVKDITDIEFEKL